MAHDTVRSATYLKVEKKKKVKKKKRNTVSIAP